MFASGGISQIVVFKLFKSTWQLRLKISEEVNHAIIKEEKQQQEFFSKFETQEMEIVVPSFEHQDFELYLVVFLENSKINKLNNSQDIYLEIYFEMDHNSEDFETEQSSNIPNSSLRKPVSSGKDYYLEILVIGLVLTIVVVIIVTIFCCKKCKTSKKEKNHKKKSFQIDPNHAIQVEKQEILPDCTKYQLI